jgi:tripartite-type tricarboxylate transporter receptor subunit TctC
VATHRVIVVDNRPGAAGVIAAHAAATATPDGNTLLSVSTAHAIAPAIYADLPYDTQRDFSGITLTAKSKYVLVVAPRKGYASLEELLAAARAHPRSLAFSSAGVGSGSHFAAEMLARSAKIEVLHVPFKGIPEALTETISGRVEFFMAPIANAMPLVAAHRMIALGVSSPRRDPLLPDVPAIAETLPDFASELWFGLLVPSQTPRAVVARLNRDVERILREPALEQRWRPLGLEPAPCTPAAFDRLVASDMRRYQALARAAGLKAD